jgi:hypothetical protein
VESRCLVPRAHGALYHDLLRELSGKFLRPCQCGPEATMHYPARH